MIPGVILGAGRSMRGGRTHGHLQTTFFCSILVKIPYICTQWKTIPHHMETDLQTLRHCEGAALLKEWMKLLDKQEWERVPSSPKIHQCLCSRRQRHFSPESQTQLPLPLPKGRSMWRSHNHPRDGETWLGGVCMHALTPTELRLTSSHEDQLIILMLYWQKDKACFNHVENTD